MRHPALVELFQHDDRVIQLRRRASAARFE
jgi:hypothetical protein